MVPFIGSELFFTANSYAGFACQSPSEGKLAFSPEYFRIQESIIKMCEI